MKKGFLGYIGIVKSDGDVLTKDLYSPGDLGDHFSVFGHGAYASNRWRYLVKARVVLWTDVASEDDKRSVEDWLGGGGFTVKAQISLFLNDAQGTTLGLGEVEDVG